MNAIPRDALGVRESASIREWRKIVRLGDVSHGRRLSTLHIERLADTIPGLQDLEGQIPGNERHLALDDSHTFPSLRLVYVQQA